MSWSYLGRTLSNPSTASTSVSNHTGRVLIVDDTSTNRLILSKLLTQKGYEVCEAKDGATALAIAQARHPTIILLDIMMPIMDGIETVKRLKSMDSIENVPIILVLTNKGDMETVSEMMTLNMLKYVVKADHSLQSIVDTVKSALKF